YTGGSTGAKPYAYEYDVGPTLPPPPVGSYEKLATPTPVGPSGTYPYDGGPRNAVPLPKTQQKAPSQPAPAPGDGRMVSWTAKSVKLAYPAYGEKPGRILPDASTAFQPSVLTVKKSVR